MLHRRRESADDGCADDGVPAHGRTGERTAGRSFVRPSVARVLCRRRWSFVKAACLDWIAAAASDIDRSCSARALFEITRELRGTLLG